MFFVVVKTSHYLRILFYQQSKFYYSKVSLNSGMFLTLQKNIVDDVFSLGTKYFHLLYFFVVVKISHNLRILFYQQSKFYYSKVSLNCGMFLPLQKNIVDNVFSLSNKIFSSTMFFVVVKTSHYLRILFYQQSKFYYSKVSLNCGMFLPIQKNIVDNVFSLSNKIFSSIMFFVVVKISHYLRILFYQQSKFYYSKVSLNCGMFLPLQKNIMDDVFSLEQQNIFIYYVFLQCVKNIPLFKDTFLPIE